MPITDRGLRYMLVGFGALAVLLTAGFFWEWPPVIALWPWPATRLSYVFLASIAAAIAAPILWVGWSGELGALRGGAINLAISNLGIALTALVLYPNPPGTVVLGLGALALAGLSGAIYAGARRRPIIDPRPMPGLVRLSFGAFAAILIVVGLALIFGAQVFPWTLQPAGAAAYGWIFVGAATYFLDGVVRPRWHNARGQLLGFLAYDLVLLGPFLAHFNAVLPDHRLSLIIYVAVLVYSGGLAIYYLFLAPATRAGTAPSAIPETPSLT
jgi:hypothetical protein